MLGLPTTWLVGGAVIAVGLFFGAVQIRHQAKLAAATETGIAIGTGKAATATLEAAAKTADAERLAEAETPLDADLAYYKKLCGQSASCRSRSKYR